MPWSLKGGDLVGGMAISIKYLKTSWNFQRRDLSNMQDPTSSYATISIDLGVIRTCKPLYHVRMKTQWRHGSISHWGEFKTLTFAPSRTSLNWVPRTGSRKWRQPIWYWHHLLSADRSTKIMWVLLQYTQYAQWCERCPLLFSISTNWRTIRKVLGRERYLINRFNQINKCYQVFSMNLPFL